MKHTRCLLPLLLATASLSGCAWRSYTPAPLDLPAAAEADAARRVDDVSVRDALQAAGIDTAAWPDLQWTREALLVSLLATHPEQRAARARVRAADAKIPAVQQPVNPELSGTAENRNHSGSESPWSVGAGLQFTLNTGPLRRALGDVAAAEASDARLAAGETAWTLYRKLGDALLERQLAGERVFLAARGLELAEARNQSMMVRQRYGAASALEVQLAAERLLTAKRELADADAAQRAAHAGLAAALATDADALARVRLADWQPGGLPGADEARRIALRNRLDLARELARYEVAEGEVRVEVARQYPRVQMGPGLLWDQGARVWQFGFSLPVSLLQRNRAAIDAAELRRSAQGAQVLARQSAIINEVESLRRQADALREPLQVAAAAVESASAQLRLAQRQFDAGRIDALALIDARSLQLQAERALAESRAAGWRAQWALEAALQAPLPIRADDAVNGQR